MKHAAESNHPGSTVPQLGASLISQTSRASPTHPTTMPSLLGKLTALPEPESNILTSSLNYSAEGISEKDTPALLRISQGDHFGDELDRAEEEAGKNEAGTDFFKLFNHAQTHAWRALAQLKKTDHIQHFIHLLENEPPSSFSPLRSDFKHIMIHDYGAISLKHLQPYFFDARNDADTSSIIVQTLSQMGHIPEARETIIGIFVKYLDHSPNTRKINAHIVNGLVDIQAKESIASIQNIFAKHLIELPISGDLESCETKLGARKTRTTKSPNKPQLLKQESRSIILSRKDHYQPLLENPTPYRTLEYFLEVYKTDTSLTSPSKIEGLIIAALTCHQSISLLKLTLYIWDPYQGTPQNSPTWITPEDQKRFNNALKATHKNISDHLSAQRIEPTLILENNSPSYFRWVRGLIIGLDLWPSKKQDLDLHKHLINTAYQVLRYEDDKEYSDTETKEQFDHLIQSIFRLSSQDQSTTSQFTTAVTTVIETDTPRNAPCPCNSGKKYKRCCMN